MLRLREKRVPTLRLPRVPPRRRQVPPSLHPRQVQAPLQRNRKVPSWRT
ncbi:hypothetical protein IEO21_10568 [Rhodonia placenta]|uniref:Uncharacterized protein n=1 Tax=Rhodonia placenta TaxID=104341 RepID=A0A8H7TXB2_9APHY|nr:hypothetical protein IEO21_10568 [Postia placenta]